VEEMVKEYLVRLEPGVYLYRFAGVDGVTAGNNKYEALRFLTFAGATKELEYTKLNKCLPDACVEVIGE
jgi:hypothetical protein